MEFLQQQQIIARLQKQHLQEQIRQKQQKPASSPSHAVLGNLNVLQQKRNDDDLINCILEMKPPTNSQPNNYMNVNATNYQNQFYSDQSRQRNDLTSANGSNGSRKIASSQSSLGLHGAQQQQQQHTPSRQVSSV